MDSTKDDNVKVVTSGEDVAVHKSALKFLIHSIKTICYLKKPAKVVFGKLENNSNSYRWPSARKISEVAS
jgi:hypothetical protein